MPGAAWAGCWEGFWDAVVHVQGNSFLPTALPHFVLLRHALQAARQDSSVEARALQMQLEHARRWAGSLQRCWPKHSVCLMAYTALIALHAC